MASVNNTSSDITAVVQNYVNRRSLAQPKFVNGLLKYGIPATIPKGNGGTGTWFRWNRLSLPSTYSETAEPTGQSMDAATYSATLVIIKDAVTTTEYGEAVRFASVIDQAYDELTLGLARKANNILMGVLGNTSTGLHAQYSNGRSTFAELTQGDMLTNDDISAAVAYLEQNQAPGPYYVVLNRFDKQDLLQKDKDFRDLITRTTLDPLKKNEFPTWAGARIDYQDDCWRENTEGTYNASGRVVSSYVFSEAAFGQVELGGKTGLKPKFHAQNISITGSTMSIGYWQPYQGIVMKPEWGVVMKSYASNPGNVTSVSVS